MLMLHLLGATAITIFMPTNVQRVFYGSLSLIDGTQCTRATGTQRSTHDPKSKAYMQHNGE